MNNAKFLNKNYHGDYTFLLSKPFLNLFKRDTITILKEDINRKNQAFLEQLTPNQEVEINFVVSNREGKEIYQLSEIHCKEIPDIEYDKLLEYDPTWNEKQEREKEKLYRQLINQKPFFLKAFNDRLKLEKHSQELATYRLFFTRKITELENQLLTQKNENRQILTFLQTELHLKEEELKKTREESTTSTASLRTEIKELETKLTQSQAENNRLIALEKQLTEIQNLLNENQEKLTTKEQDLEKLTLANQSLLEKITNLEIELKSQDNLITNLEKSKLEITNQLTQLKTNLADKSLSLEEAQEEISQLSLNLLYQQKLSSKFTKEKQELNNSYNLPEEQLDSLKNDTSEQLALVEKEKLLSAQNFTNLQQQNKDLLQEKKQLASDLNKISWEKEKSEKDAKNASENLTNLKTELTNLRSEKRTLLSDLKVKTKEITNLQQNISELATIINDYQKPTQNNHDNNSSPAQKDNWLKNHSKTLLVYGIMVIGSYYLLKE